jgi:hypothetical protein
MPGGLAATLYPKPRGVCRSRTRLCVRRRPTGEYVMAGSPVADRSLGEGFAPQELGRGAGYGSSTSRAPSAASFTYFSPRVYCKWGCGKGCGVFYHHHGHFLLSIRGPGHLGRQCGRQEGELGCSRGADTRKAEVLEKKREEVQAAAGRADDVHAAACLAPGRRPSARAVPGGPPGPDRGPVSGSSSATCASTSRRAIHSRPR